jgi:hypothetical protein
MESGNVRGASTIAMGELETYCQGFKRALEPWPPLPQGEAADLVWWQELLATSASGCLQGPTLLEALQAALPQLRLPQVSGISSSELYKRAVLRGETPSAAELTAAGPGPHWQQPQQLSLTLAPHSCGAMPVLRTPSQADFDLLVRALAHRAEPVVLAHGVHAQAISGLIHWGLIQRVNRQCRARLIVLHDSPYGSVPAQHVPGAPSDAAWLAASTTLRLEHELTHLATKHLLGEMRLNLLDELIADCMGMVAALGTFHSTLFGRCLGLDADGAPLTGGRWTTYVAQLKEKDAAQALTLTMQRARELEAHLLRNPELLAPAQNLKLLNWLCQQRLDRPISPTKDR